MERMKTPPSESLSYFNQIIAGSNISPDEIEKLFEAFNCVKDTALIKEVLKWKQKKQKN